MADSDWVLQDIQGSDGRPAVRLPVTIRDKSVTLKFKPPAPEPVGYPPLYLSSMNTYLH